MTIEGKISRQSKIITVFFLFFLPLAVIAEEKPPKAEPEAKSTVSFVDQQLSNLVARHQKIITTLAENPKEELSSAEIVEIQSLIRDYESFTLRYKDNVTGYVFFGKFLRSVNKPYEAYLIFLKADAIDPKIAVVKQQIGNYLTETGRWQEAFQFLQEAATLEPETAVYHFQLGVFLSLYHDLILEDKILAEDVLNKSIRDAYGKASELEPENMEYAFRAAESLSEEKNPDWQLSLDAWDKVLPRCTTEIRKQAVQLARARALFRLKRDSEASSALDLVTLPELQSMKTEIKASSVPEPETKED